MGNQQNIINKINVTEEMGHSEERETKVVYPKVKLRFNDILTTAMRHASKTKGGILLAGDTVKGGKVDAPLMTTQLVVARGENSSYQIGDVVEVNHDSFMKKPNPNPSDIGDAGSTMMAPVEWIEDEKYLMLTDRQLKYSYEDRDVTGEELLLKLREDNPFQ